MRAVFVAAAVAGCVILPAGSARGQAPDRSGPPELGPPPRLALPPIQRFTLANGLEVVLLEKHQVPLVQVNVLVRAGSAMDPAARGGTASITAAMLDEGAGDRSALAIADAVDFLGAELTTGSGMHTSQVSLRVPVARLDSALAVLSDVVMRPTFPPDELERQRAQRLTALAQRRDEPRAIASVLFNRTLFGTNHPYGVPTTGDERSVAGLQASGLREFHATWYRPNNATVIVVGDVTAEQIRTRLERALGSWAAAPVPATRWATPRQVARRQVLLVDKPGAAQSEIRIGRIGPPRATDDYYALVVMNTVLGGSFSSRLNQNLRETHGYAYGAGSVFDFRPLPGAFVALAAVQTNATDSALTEFMKELRGIVAQVSDEELTRARNYVALQFPEAFQRVSGTADQIAELVTYDLPDDYFSGYVDRILGVTRADVARVAKQHIDPERVVIVVVGDRARIETGVRALKLGPATVLSVDDVLGKGP